MKRFLCIMLSALLFCNTTVVRADDLHGGSSGSIDFTPTPIVLPDNSAEMISELMVRLIRPDVAGVVDTFQTWWDKWIGERWKTNADMLKDVSLSSDGSTVHLHKQFVDDVNQAVQDKIHALDGYVLYVPDHSLSDFPFEKSYKNYYGMYSDVSNSWLDANFDGYKSKFQDNNTFFTGFVSVGTVSNCYDSAYIYNMNSSSRYLVYGTYGSSKSVCVYETDSDNNLTVLYDSYVMRCPDIYHNNNELYWAYRALPTNYTGSNPFCYLDDKNMCNAYGAPIRVFYSLQDLKNFLNKGRTYAPKLPNVTIKIPVKYINNSVSLPDITYNITTENKTETEIQNQYDITIKNYLDSLDDFSDGSTTTPTLTPKPDGGFTDGTTPTPTPAIGDGGDDYGNGKVDLSEITDLLKKILDKLTS